MTLANETATKLQDAAYKTKSGMPWGSFKDMLATVSSEVSTAGAVDYIVTSGLRKASLGDSFMSLCFTPEFRYHMLPWK